MKIKLILATALSCPFILQALNLAEMGRSSRPDRPQIARSSSTAVGQSNSVGKPTVATPPKAEPQTKKKEVEISEKSGQSSEVSATSRSSQLSVTQDPLEDRPASRGTVGKSALQQADAQLNTERPAKSDESVIGLLDPASSSDGPASNLSLIHVGNPVFTSRPIGAALQPAFQQKDSDRIFSLSAVEPTSQIALAPISGRPPQFSTGVEALATPTAEALNTPGNIADVWTEQQSFRQPSVSDHLTQRQLVAQSMPSSVADRETISTQSSKSTEPAVKLSLNQALSKARQNSLDVQGASNQVAQAKTDLSDAKAALWPTLSLELEVSGSNDSLDILEERAEEDLGATSESEFETNLADPTSTVTGDLELSYDIYTGGERGATIRQAREELYQAKLELISQTLKTENSVASAYYDLQEAAEQIKIAQQSIAHSESLLESSEALLQVGRATKADVLKAQVKVANARQTLVTAQGKKTVAQSKLAELLNLEGTTNIVATDPVAPVAQWTQSLEATIAEALKNRPEPQEQLAQKRIEAANRTIAKSQLRPTVEIYGEVEGTKVLVPGQSELRNLDEQGVGVGWEAGIVLDWTLFDGFSARSQAKKAELAMQAAEKNYISAQNSIRQEVQQAFANLGTSQQNMATALDAVNVAEANLQATETRFRTGFGDQIDVVSAVDDLDQARLNYVSAVLSYNRAIISLENATNRRLAKTTLLTKKEG